MPYRTHARHLLIFLIIISALLIIRPAPAYAAYRSWVRGTPEYDAAMETLTGIDNGGAVINTHPDDTDPDTTEKMWSKILVGWGTGISKALKGGTIDASITGITMGKLVNGVNYFVFDLTDQNPYGVIGSVIYVAFRHLCLSIIFVFVLWKIVAGGIFSDGPGFGKLKSAVYSLIIFLLLLYCMPLVVDWICELRDIISVKVFNDLGTVVTGATTGLQSTLSLEDEYLQNYNSSKTTLDALIYFAMCITPIMYFLSYLKIALTVLVMFGMFPLFATVSVRDPKLLGNWCSIVFANLFVPMVDILILLIPSLVITIMDSVAGGMDGSVLKAVLVVMMLINAIGAREMVLKMFGNSLGVSGGLGALGAAGAIAGMAKKAFGAAKDALGGGGGDSEKGDGGMDQDEANDRDAESEKHLKDTQDSLSEIKGSNEDKHDGDGGMGDDAGDGDNDGGLQDLPPLEGNELNTFSNGDENDEGGAIDDEGGGEEDGPDEEAPEQQLNDGEPLNEIEPSGGAGGEEIPDNGEDNPESNDSGDGNRIVDDYGGDGERPEIVGAQAEGDIGGDLGNNENDLSSIDPSMPESGLTGKETGGHLSDAGDGNPHDGANDVPSSGGDLKGTEEVPVRIESAGGGMGYGGDGGSDDQFNPSDTDVPANPLDSMRKDEASPGSLSNVQSEADKAIRDATVSKDDLEQSTGGELGNVSRQVAENSPQSAGPNKDLDREINMTRAANLQTLDNLRAKSEMLDKDNAAAQQTIASNSSLIQSNAAKLSDLDRREKSIYDKYGGKEKFQPNSGDIGQMIDKENLDSIQKERQQLETSSRNAEQSVEAAKNRIAGNQAVKQHLSAEIDRRQGTEAELANIQENRGMSGRKYSSTKEFTRQLEHDNNLRKTMSYKNFMNDKYSGVLTPQEKAQFQRQQNIRRAVGATARFAGNMAGGAAMAVGGAAAMVALSGMGADGVQIGADIMATGLGKMGAGVAQPVSAVGRKIKDAAGDAGTQIAYRAPDVARAAKDKYDSYNQKWTEHQNALNQPNEDKGPLVTRKDLAARRAAQGADTPQRNPKDMPLNNIGGSEEAKMFRSQMDAGKGDPVVESRAKQAEAAARKAQQDFEKRSGGTPPHELRKGPGNKDNQVVLRAYDPVQRKYITRTQKELDALPLDKKFSLMAYFSSLPKTKEEAGILPDIPDS